MSGAQARGGPAGKSGRLRVGIDVSVLAMPQVAGRRFYLRSLLAELLRRDDMEWVLLHAGSRAGVEAELPTGAAISQVHLIPFSHGAALFHHGLWASPLPAPALPRDLALDVYHAGEFYFPDDLRGTAGVATVHDLTSLILPECHPVAGRLRDRRQLAWIRRQGVHCIAVSGSTARDLVRIGAVAPDRIDVVHEAAALAAAPQDGTAARSRYDLGSGPFILHVGTLEPRKNIIRLIHAFEQLGPEFADWQLVLAGRTGWRFRPTLKAAAGSAVSARIRLLGAVPAAALATLYAEAEAVVYPSLYEGFGLPVLEAMAAGKAVLTSNCSSLPEVAGDAALLVDPQDTESIRRALERLLREPALREDLARKGLKRATLFSWKAAADGTFEAYVRALAQQPRARMTRVAGK